MKILFVGNSYTYFNDLPERVKKLAKDSSIELTVHSVTKGGRHLYENLGDDEWAKQLKKLVGENRYDVAILQEQSFFALIDYEKFESSVGELCKLIGAKRTILYSTWGRKEGCELLDEHGWTSRGMTDALFSAYTSAARKHSAEVCPVGLCFGYINDNLSEPELYNQDKSHPNETGTSLAAIAFFKKIFGKYPDSYDSLGLGEDTVKTLVSAVKNYL